MNYTHFVLTYSGTKLKITDEEHEKFIHLGAKDKIVIDGHLIVGSSISEIVPIETYYSNHPQDRPMPQYQMLEAPKEEPLTRERYIHAARSTLKGLRQYIDESPNPTQTAIKIAKTLADKIKDAKDGVGKFAKSQQEIIKQIT